MTEYTSAVEEIRATYDEATLLKIKEQGCRSGAAEKHNVPSQTNSFFDKYEVEIKGYIANELGDEYNHELWCNNSCDLKGYKNASTWTFIECVAEALWEQGTWPEEKLADDYFDSGEEKYGDMDYEGALEDYKKAIALNPNHASAYTGAGDALSEDGDQNGGGPEKFTEAIGYLDKSIEIEPNNAYAYSCRAIAKSRLDDLEGAIADYEKAFEIRPDSGHKETVGGFYHHLGKFEEAIKAFSEGIEYAEKMATPPNFLISPDLFKGRGDAKKELGDTKGAYKDWKKAKEMKAILEKD